jgi:hypothetical protein
MILRHIPSASATGSDGVPARTKPEDPILLNMPPEPKNLEQLLDRICDADSDQDKVYLEKILDSVGRRSFGPLLLLTGSILFSPLSGIPTMPTTMSLILLLIALQLLFNRRHFWLPRWILKRSIARDKLIKAVKWLRPVAAFVDRFLRERLTVFVEDSGIRVVAFICIMIAAGIPVMELVPFSATGAGAALTAFGLGLIARDGLLALLAFAVTIFTFGIVFFHFF